ncbi:MAG: putative DNA-binding protein [Limosilactobacillus sp.]|uniref:putative DNA-binding protein n=1 Tax=Limosilactobacillus sp. TaxID=2773925 RepID=UPI00270F0234|nr:putative DNA-binding protein [Limosilactobacillus sp.]
MEIEKNYRINSLFEFYQPLLTKKQNDYLDLYYGDDYSLGEIAENFNVSRQAVYDNIKRTEAILEDYEDKLHLFATFQAQSKQADEIQQYVSKHYPDDAKLNELVNRLESLEEE